MLTREFARQLERVVRNRRQSLVEYLGRRFPRVDRHRVEDAVSDAIEDAFTHPESYKTAGSQGDMAVCSLLRVVAWRKLRHWYRRPATRNEVGFPFVPDRPDPQVLEGRLIARLDLDRMKGLVRSAARKTCPAQADALARALEARLGGASDTEASREQGVPREYVNRARHWILERVKDE